MRNGASDFAVLILTASAILVAGCDRGDRQAPVPVAAGEVRGVITEARAGEGGNAASLTIVSPDGTTRRFELPWDVTRAAPVAHLQAHQNARWPVVVSYWRDNDRLIALAIKDG